MRGREDPVRIVLREGRLRPGVPPRDAEAEARTHPGLGELSVRDRTWRSVPVPRNPLIGRAAASSRE